MQENNVSSPASRSELFIQLIKHITYMCTHLLTKIKVE